ncbi:MAG: hypothetical protein AAFN27_21440 [Pseudomonadota bacterium]
MYDIESQTSTRRKFLQGAACSVASTPLLAPQRADAYYPVIRLVMIAAARMSNAYVRQLARKIVSYWFSSDTIKFEDGGVSVPCGDGGRGINFDWNLTSDLMHRSYRAVLKRDQSKSCGGRYFISTRSLAKNFLAVLGRELAYKAYSQYKGENNIRFVNDGDYVEALSGYIRTVNVFSGESVTQQEWFGKFQPHTSDEFSVEVNMKPGVHRILATQNQDNGSEYLRDFSKELVISGLG